ncbi:MAG: hypothetical protein ABIH34_07760 [Nanoarchaeota archaeon]
MGNMKRDMSNTSLALLMVVTVVITLASLFISLEKLDDLRQPPEISGFASSGGGQVNITILNFNSITLDDAQIDLGNCTPASSIGSNISSNETVAPACIQAGSGVWPDNISVHNDGNTNVNVTVQSSIVAANLIGGTAPAFWFMTKNATIYGGCSNESSTCGDGVCDCSNQNNCTYQVNWTSFAAVGTEYNACKNLTYGGTSVTRPRFYLFAKVHVPADALGKTNANATLTFTAYTPTSAD